jgi:hypothetical protein
LPEGEWEVTAQPQSFDGSRHFVLRNLRRDRYVLLSAQEHFLWNLFDGNHTLGEIARVCHFEFGTFDYTIIHQLLTRLYSAGLLAEVGATGVQSSVASKSSRRWARALIRAARPEPASLSRSATPTVIAPRSTARRIFSSTRSRSRYALGSQLTQS